MANGLFVKSLRLLLLLLRTRSRVTDAAQLRFKHLLHFWLLSSTYSVVSRNRQDSNTG